MQKYRYKAYDSSGAARSGAIEAQTQEEARALLRGRGLHVASVALARTRPLRVGAWRHSRKRLYMVSSWVSRLATLLGSGVAMMEALRALSDQSEDPDLAAASAQLAERVSSGSSLAEAMEDMGEWFDPMIVNLVRAGEASGAMAPVLEKLAEHLNAAGKKRAQIGTLFVYPVILLVIMLGVVIFLTTFVIPKLSALFDRMDKALPLPTAIMLNTSRFLQHWGIFVLAGVVGIVIALVFYGRTPDGRRRFERFLLSIPIIGKVAALQIVARFAGTLATLLASGIPAYEALGIVQRVVSNSVFADAISRIREAVLAGRDIAGPMGEEKVFPSSVVYMVSVGEKTGRLDDILERIADHFDDEAEIIATRAMTLLEPIIVLILAMAVLFIVVAIVLPILELSAVIG